MHELTEMLPVGMVANGGIVAQIMADLAQQQRNLPGWEAFHYEKISDVAVELTGGIVSQNQGHKRWLEPHDCISIALADIVLEMQKRGLCPAAPEMEVENRVLETAKSRVDANPNAQQLHVTLVLPDDAEARLRVLQAFHLDAQINGARVIACHFENERGKAST